MANVVFENRVLTDPVLAIHGSSSAVVKASNQFSYTNADGIVYVPAGDLPALPGTILTGYTGVYSLFGDYTGNLTWVQGTNIATVTRYVVTVSGITTPPSTNAVYTNNSQTFTVQLNNLVLSAGTYSGTISLTGTGAPAASGTLTKSNGTGDATITFSAFISTYFVPYSAAPNVVVNLGANTFQTLYTPLSNQVVQSYAFPTRMTWIDQVTIINATGSTFTGGTTALDTASLTVYYSNRYLSATGNL